MPRKIVVNGKFASQKTTGVQRVAASHVEGLIRKRTDGSLDGLELSIAYPSGIASKPFPGLAASAGKLKGVPWEQLELPQQAGNGVLLSLCNVAPLARKGDVVMIHDAQAFISPESYSKAFGLWYRTILPILANRAAKVLTVSEYARQCLAEAHVAPYERIQVVHNGVDHVLSISADESILRRLRLAGGDYILALSTPQKHKNISTLMSAMTRVRQSDAGLKLVLMGSANAKTFADAGIEVHSDVVFAGRVTDEEMRTLYENALAFAFPSLTEGFGLPPLEAMILGTPAIVARAGAMPELCGSAAVYAEPQNPDSWAEEVLRLAQSSEIYKSLSIASREQAQKFTWATATESMAKHLLDVAG